MNNDTNIAYFISFCIEQYKKHINVSGDEVALLFDKYGITDYLVDNFEILHTQNHHWLMEELDQLLHEKKSSI